MNMYPSLSMRALRRYRYLMWRPLTIAVVIVGMLAGIAAAGFSTFPTSSAQFLPQVQQKEVGANSAALDTDAIEQSRGRTYAIVIYSHTDGTPLTRTDISQAATGLREIAQMHKGRPRLSTPPVSEDNMGVIADQDRSIIGQIARDAAMGVVRINANMPDHDIVATMDRIHDIANQASPREVSVAITGPLAFHADRIRAIEWAWPRIIGIVAIGIVLIMGYCYRSPLIGIFPALSVMIVGSIMIWATRVVTGALSLRFFGASGIIAYILTAIMTVMCMVFILSRYREELQKSSRPGRKPDPDLLSPALVTTMRGCARALIGFALVTGVVGVVACAIPAPVFRVCGIATIIGACVVAVWSCVVVPAAISIAGTRMYWPKIPRGFLHEAPPDETDDIASFEVLADSSPKRPLFRRTAQRATKRPIFVMVVAFLALIVCASGYSVAYVGLSTVQRFSSEVESGRGQEILDDHHYSGLSDPLTLELPATHSQENVKRILAMPEVIAISDINTTDHITHATVWGKAAPSLDKALRDMRTIQNALLLHTSQARIHSISLDEAEARENLSRAMPWIIVSVVLGAGIAMSVATGGIIVGGLAAGISGITAGAAIGVGSFVSHVVATFPAMDYAVPLVAFLVIMAVGSAYPVVVLARAKTTIRALAPRPDATAYSVITAVGDTGAVLIICGMMGVAIAAVMCIVPLVPFIQIGLTLALGILMHVFVVRTIILPASATLIGKGLWWPQRRRPTA